MRTTYILFIFAVGSLLAASNAQQNYDGRNGPQQFGTPGNEIYIRGQNEGPYTVPGVGGTFQNSPASGQHVYTDEQGNTYTHTHSSTTNEMISASSPLGFSAGGVLLLLLSLITI
ncbi:immune-induced peptides [Drosophila subpulchrella]|uniref:immune-induced peptides n=1 Tax=Drosophila subpulchrella TaxID=1486046 RepID=UPI0018A13B2F|nr:immune-induced peptides [Drosophila subpulchrella]